MFLILYFVKFGTRSKYPSALSLSFSIVFLLMFIFLSSVVVSVLWRPAEMPQPPRRKTDVRQKIYKVGKTNIPNKNPQKNLQKN